MKPLSEELMQWRCERPAEWEMDEFIRRALELESYVAELEDDVRYSDMQVESLGDMLDVYMEDL